MIPLGTCATAVIKGDPRNGLPVEIVSAFDDDLYAVRTEDGRAFPLHASEIHPHTEGCGIVGVAAE